MKAGAPESFGARLKALRETAGFTQEELATIAGLSVHAVSSLERGERRRPHVETVRALSAAFDLTGAALNAFLQSARAPAHTAAVDDLRGASLPLPPTALVGRDTEIASLQQWLSDPAFRLITLIGPGGVGKTRLVLELARATEAGGATRVVFVSLGAIRDPAFVASAIAEALGLHDISATDLPGRARVACGDQQMLLVLDNFEQVLAAAPLVVDLLTSVALLRILVTSREPLRLRGEREYPVGPLALGERSEAMPLPDLARVPAIRLFVERVRDVRPDFRLTRANGPTVAAICRRLDALPLALELAAPWAKVLTPEDLLQRLGRNVLLAAPGPRDLPERQQTVNATVTWSYQLLDAEDQRAFRRFGAMPGLFSVDAAAEVLAGRDGDSAASDHALGVVARLVDKSLLVRAESPAISKRPVYFMLETVRAYAALDLSAAGERDDALEGLARHCAREASLAAAGLVGPAQIEWLGRVREDLDIYRVALSWLIERDRTVEAAAIACNLLTFWVVRGYAVEGLRWYQQILGRSPLPAPVEAITRVAEGLMWYAHGELAHARTAVERGLTLAPPGSDMLVVGDIVLGHIEYGSGNLAGAHARFSGGLRGFRTSSVPWGIGHALTGLAQVAIHAGDADEAERLLDEAASVLRYAGPFYLCLALCTRAVLAVQRGDAAHAILLVGESLPHIRALHDKFAFIGAMAILSAAFSLKGDHAWAARLIGVHDVVHDRTGATLVGHIRNLRDETETTARARLSPAEWTRFYTAGRSASIDVLIQEMEAVRTRTSRKALDA